MLVYLSGPISATLEHSEQQNADKAIEIFFILIRAGVNAVCPHIISKLGDASTVSYERWMEWDFAMIDASTHVLMLPRWEESPGACREREYAERTGKTVLYEIPELL